MGSKIFQFSFWLIGIIFLCSFVQAQNTREEHREIAKRLVGQWEMNVLLSVKIYGNTSWPLGKSLEFIPSESVVDLKLPPKWEKRWMYRDNYLLGRMKTEEQEFPFILAKNEDTLGIAFFPKREEGVNQEWLIVFMPMSRSPENDLLFLKLDSSKETFVVFEKKESYKKEIAPEKESSDAKSMKKFSPRWYMCRINKKYVGYLHTVANVTGNEASPISFSHKIVINDRGTEIYQDLLIFCQNDEYYRPVKIVCKGKGMGKGAFPSFITTIESNGMLNTTLDGRPFSMQVPSRTTLYPGIFHIIPQLPLDTQTSFKYNSLEIEVEQLTLKPNLVITYRGKEEIEIDGEKQNLHKFVQSNPDGPFSYFWLDDQKNLIRAVIEEDKEFLLTTKNKALRGKE